MVERRFDEDGSSSADELEGMWTDRGCGAALYDPGAESGNTRVTRARSYQGQRLKLHQGGAYTVNSCVRPRVVDTPLPLALGAGEEPLASREEGVEIDTAN